jgi:hypothetical protein
LGDVHPGFLFALILADRSTDAAQAASRFTFPIAILPGPSDPGSTGPLASKESELSSETPSVIRAGESAKIYATQPAVAGPAVMALARPGQQGRPCPSRPECPVNHPAAGDADCDPWKQSESMADPMSGLLVYDLTIHGAMSDVLRAEFDDVELEVAHGETHLRAVLPDSAALYGLIGRIEALGLVMLDLHRSNAPATVDDRPSASTITPVSTSVATPPSASSTDVPPRP